MKISADKSKKILEFGPIGNDSSGGQGSYVILFSFVILFIFVASIAGYTFIKLRDFERQTQASLNFQLNDSKTYLGSNLKGFEERIETLEELVEPFSVLEPKYAVDESVRKINDAIWRLNEERFHVIEGKVDSMTQELTLAREKIENQNKRELIFISLINLVQRINSGKPFQTELDTAVSAAEKDNVIQQNLAFLRPYASYGIPSLNQLSNEFTVLAPKILKASYSEIKENPTVWERIKGNISNSFVIRKIGYVEGESNEAVVARVENLLRKDKLSLALQEVEKIKRDQSGELYEWVDKAYSLKQSENSISNIMGYLSDKSLNKLMEQQNQTSQSEQEENLASN